ncbi:hypothetical protein J4Q44_G00174100 [Coregonus suidteri]|uniref:Uncharacterized protein n=1 Tax=Coregonus suidteri TaxID=861788 RepID=A0AAN8M437_9TELE
MESKESEGSEVKMMISPSQILESQPLDDPINNADDMQDEVRCEKDQPDTGSLAQFFADQETASPNQSIAAEPEAEMQEAYLKSADPTQSLEAEIDSDMQADLQTAGPSHVQEPHQTSLLNPGDLELEDTDVTFTTTPTPPQAATSQNSLVRLQRSSLDLCTFLQDMTDDHWNLLSEKMRPKLTRDEFTAKCMDIVTWVKKTTSTVVFPALDLTMQIELTESPGSPGSGSEEAGEVTSLSRTVTLSCTQGTSSKTSWSTRTPIPFPSSHRSMTSLLSEEDNEDLIPGEFTYLSTPEGGNREVRDRPCSEPLRSVFGLSQSCVFNQMVRSGACRSLSEIVLPSSRSRQRKLRPIIVSTDTRLVMGIVEMVMKVLNSRLAQLMLNVGHGSNSASIQFAQEMLSMATASMYAHAMEHIAHGRKSSSPQSKSQLELERELEAILGPLAGQVIVTIINSILRTKDNGRTEQERTNPLSYFLTAVSAEIQSLVVQRSASRQSSRQSISDHLLNISKGKIVKAVQIKMSQLYGESTNESCISTTPTIQSLSKCPSKESLCDWTLNSDNVHPAKFLSSNRITALSTDVVDVVFGDVLYNLGLLDSQTPLRPQNASSSSSIDISGVAGEMVRQVSVKLQPFVSESSLEAMSMTHDSSSLPISDSDLKLLCSHSAVAVATACQAIKTELEMSLNSATEAGSQCNLAARDLVSSLSQSLEDMDVSHIIRGLNEAAVTFPNLNETPSTYTNRLEEILSAHISPERIAAASVDLFDGVLADLHEASESNKVSAATKSGRKKFWVVVHSSSQNLYTNALDKLNKWFSLHHLTEEEDVPQMTKLSATGPLLTEACLEVSPVQKTSSNSSGMSFRSLSNISDNQLTLNTCTKEVIKQVASVLKVEASKEDCSPSIGGRTSNVTKQSFTKSAKNTLSQILNVIKCRVAASDNLSVRQKTTDMLDSLLESLDQLTADEIKGTASHTSTTIDVPESLSKLSLTKYLSTHERNQDASPAKLVCQPSCLIPTYMCDTNIIGQTIMETMETDNSKKTSAEENLERLLSIETIQGVSDDLITKVHGLIQEITISRQRQSMAGHRSFSEPALPKPALKKLSRNDASELAYSFVENSVRTLLGQCLDVSPFSTGVRQTMDQVTKIMTNTVMDNLTDVSKPTVKSEDELISRLVLPDEFPTRSLNPADGNADVMPPSAGVEKKSKKWRFLFKMPNIPKIRIKVFKRKGQAKKHPELEALPTKRFSVMSLNAECEVPEVPSTSPPMEDLIPAPTAQDPQSRKCPLVVRVFRALSRAITSPFRGASGKKH